MKPRTPFSTNFAGAEDMSLAQEPGVPDIRYDSTISSR
jgi:hypothetical protein